MGRCSALIYRFRVGVIGVVFGHECCLAAAEEF